MRKQSGLIPTMPWLTNTLNKQGRYEEAIEACEQAIRLDPNDAGAYSSKGVALNGQGRYEEAIKACEQAIRLNPNDAEAYSDKEAARYSLGRYKEQIKACE